LKYRIILVKDDPDFDKIRSTFFIKPPRKIRGKPIFTVDLNPGLS